MFLDRVTITGADDTTSVTSLQELSNKYPFVEWGFLLSEYREGSNRYPSRDYLALLLNPPHIDNQKLQISFHVCGSMSRALMEGNSEPLDNFLKSVSLPSSYRIQINWNLKYAKSKPVVFDCLKQKSPEVDYIIQHNKSNRTLWIQCRAADIFPHVLFDASGGRGVVSSSFRSPLPGLFCGYAGGLNPNNIEDVLKKLENVVGEGACWVDVETGVMNSYNNLDLEKVDAFLSICSSYVLSVK